MDEQLRIAKVALESIEHKLHDGRIWGGTRWLYNPLRRELVEACAIQAREALNKIAAVKVPGSRDIGPMAMD